MTTHCKHYPTPALQKQYGGQNCQVVSHKGVPPHHDSNLPFTGMDVGLLGAVAFALIGSGVVLRRAGRKPYRSA